MAGRVVLVAVALGLALAPWPATAQWTLHTRAEGSLFADPSNTSQLPDPELGFVLHARGGLEWDSGRQWLDLEPFLRLDLVTGERTRFDLRQASWSIARGDWELTAGLGEVFWGVVESRRVVDFVNQWYSVGSLAGYEKLGQPLVRAALATELGTFEVILTPLFRERPFDGAAGGLWSPLNVEDRRSRDRTRYSSLRPDFAVHWTHYLGDVDLGLAHFSGTDRDPGFELAPQPAGSPVLVPIYTRTNRTSLDLQWTSVGWLGKLELATGMAMHGRYGAGAGGLERAFTDYLSAFFEYAYDSRGAQATTSYEHDIYAGSRLMLQEGSVEAGLFVDTSSGNLILKAGLRQRLSARLTLDVEARGFMGDAEREPPFAARQGSFLALTLTAYL
jgi:hypothetical protein